MATIQVNTQASLPQPPLNADTGFQKKHIDAFLLKQQEVRKLTDEIASKYPFTAQLLCLTVEQCDGATASLDKIEEHQRKVREAKDKIGGMAEQFRSLVKDSNLLDLIEAMKKGNEEEIQQQNTRCSSLEAQADKLERELAETKKGRLELEQALKELRAGLNIL
jgi:uncharacterized protein Yka (UPF0111/DUF47 family)